VRRFWDPVVRPLLEALQPRRVIEVGAADGRHSQRLARWCRRQGAVLHVIDPRPEFDVAAFEASYGEAVEVHVARSLDVLAGLLPAEAVLIDGDHNWYTLFQELVTLFGESGPLPPSAPLVICHDVGWPYGRRDVYYDPDSVPEAHRQPLQKGGLRPDQSGLTPLGLNRGFYHAVQEGGPKNGTRTAIQDALADRLDQFRVLWLDVLHGLGILVPRPLLVRCPALEPVLDSLQLSPGWKALAGIVEHERIEGAIALQQLAALRGERAPVPAGERPFTTSIPRELARTIQGGAMDYRYKGRRMVLHPFDLANYLALLGELRPGTVFEIGALEGGRTLWLADVLRAQGQVGNVVAVDLVPPPGLDDPCIRSLAGDARELSTVLDDGLLAALPRPWLVIEDSAHDLVTCLAVLEFFDRHLRSGDYVVIEDGNAASLLPEQAGSEPAAPSRAIARFLAGRGAAYEIDARCCDRFGYNATANPNGWLRRR
jgi:cephalosporin hydroxylase